MMNGYVENLLKRNLKKKVKVTLSLLVVFLITGTIGFAEDIHKPEQEQSQIVFLTQNISKEINKNEYQFTDENYLNAMEGLEGLGTTNISVDKTYAKGQNSLKIEKENNDYKFTFGKTTVTGNIKVSSNLISNKTAENIKNATDVTAYQELSSDFTEAENNGFIKFSSSQAQTGNQITNNGIINGYRGQKGTGKNSKVENNGILIGSTEVQVLESGSTGDLVNNGFIFAGNGNAQNTVNANLYNYGTIFATATGQRGQSTYNYGTITGATGQGVNGGIGENYGVIISSNVGQSSESGNSKVYNYGTIESTGKGMGHTQNSSLYNYGLIKVTNGFAMGNHATSSNGETVNKGVLYASENSGIFEDGKKEIKNTGIVITNADVSDKDWAKTGVTLNGSFELQNDNGITITGNTLNVDSFGDKNIGYINATNNENSMKISDITAKRNEDGDITNKKVLGVVLENKDTLGDNAILKADGNLLLDGIDMTGYLINGGTFLEVTGDLILSDTNITVTEDLTKTNGEKAVAVNLGENSKLSFLGESNINGVIKGGKGSTIDVVAQKTTFTTNTEGSLEFRNAENENLKDVNYTDVTLQGEKAETIKTEFKNTSEGKENTITINKNFVVGTEDANKDTDVIIDNSTEGNKVNYIIENIDNIHGNIKLGAGENTVTVNNNNKGFEYEINLGAGTNDKFVINGNTGENVINTFDYKVTNAETVEFNGGVWGNWINAHGQIKFDENNGIGKSDFEPNVLIGENAEMHIALNATDNHGSDFADYVNREIGENEHAVVSGNGTIKYIIGDSGLDSEKMSTDKYSFGKDLNIVSSIFNVESVENQGTTVTLKTAEDIGAFGQYRIIYDAYINQIKSDIANEKAIDKINSFDTSEDFLKHIKGIDMSGKAYYTAGSVVTKDITDTYLSAVEDFRKRAGKGEWLAQGKYINSDTEFDGGSKVKGYDGDVTGTVGMIEYGVTENTSYGVVFGKGDTEIDINGGGKLDGDNIYFGAYMKHRTQNDIELVGNIGYMESDLDSNLRSDFNAGIVGGNTYEKGTADSSAVVLSLKGRKDYRISDTVKIQPMLATRLLMINQEKAENPEMNFTIAEQDIIVVEGTAGMGIAKEFAMSNGMFEINGGVEYTFATSNSNNDAEYTLFDGTYEKTHIKMEDIDTAENRGTVYVGFDYEHENGVGFNGKYEMMWSDKGDDSRITAGISYRF